MMSFLSYELCGRGQSHYFVHETTSLSFDVIGDDLIVFDRTGHVDIHERELTL